MNLNKFLEYTGHYGTVEFPAKDNVLFGKVISVKNLISYEGESVESLQRHFEGAVSNYSAPHVGP